MGEPQADDGPHRPIMPRILRNRLNHWPEGSPIDFATKVSGKQQALRLTNLFLDTD
jgi:hypothetical protein